MKRVRLATALAATLLAAGCATPTGATAFDVDGTQVSQREVDRTAQGCATIAQQDAHTIRPQVAQFLMYGSLAEAISKRTNTTITPAMQSAAMKQVGGEGLLTDPDCGRAATGVARFAALSTALGKERIAQQVQQVDVQLNPAYGTWDPRTASFTGTSGSLSRQDLGMGQVFG